MAENQDDKKHVNNFEADSFMFWKSQIEAAETWMEKFVNQGERIVSRYRDDDRENMVMRRYNILYANTETILPVVYASPPSADVRARDPKVIAHRKAAQVVEEAVDYYIDTGHLHDAALMAVKDFLLPGMGQIRVKYKPTIAEENIDEDTEEAVIFEELEFDYIHWKDFIIPEVSTPKELPWVAFKTRLTFEEAEELLGAKAKLLSYSVVTTTEDGNKRRQNEKNSIKKATVYEIWDKTNREQVFFSDINEGKLLEINEDPLELDGFFPVPDPLLSITTSDTMLPVPFYIQYQDQALELDEVNARIANLVENMKRRGFYDASIKELGNLESMSDNTFWPVENWSEFSSKGGMQGAVSFEDITVYAQVLQILTARSQALLQEIFQIIGISDIMRAATDPRETLGAQQLKGKYGTIRISTNQRKVANFLRDVLAIAGEIIANQFAPETIAIVTNRSVETITHIEKDEETGEESTVVDEVGVADLLDSLKTKAPSDVIIDIESDSTIIEDSEEDRKVATEAIGALVEFSGVAPVLTQSIGLEATGELLVGIIEKFKLGRDIQQQVTDHVAGIIAEPPEDPPSDAEVEAQAAMQMKQLDVELETNKIIANATIKKAELQIKQQTNILKAAELGIDKEIRQQQVDLAGLDKIIQLQAIQAEAANPDDNAVVGV